MQKVKVAKAGEILEGQLKRVNANGEDIALFKVDGQIYATSNLCTHEYCTMHDNYMMHGEDVECTCHGSQFNVKTGENTLPPAAAPLPTFKVSVQGEDVFLEL